MEINPTNIASIFRGYRTLFLENLQGSAPMTEELMQRVPSTAMIEEYDWLGAIPGMKELVSEIQITNLKANTWAIRNKEWENTVAVKQSRIETDTYGIYNPLFASMGLAARQHPDQLNCALLYGGFGNKSYTGTNFFGTGHVSQPGAIPFTNTQTAALTAASYNAARTRLVGRLNAEGRAMGLGIDLVLVVPPALEATAKAILIADTILQVQGASFAAVTNINKGTARLKVIPQLGASSQTAWYLLEAGFPIKPLVFQQNKPVMLTSLTNPEADHVFKKHEFLYQGYGRYNAGYLLPELAEGSTGVA